MKNPVTLEIARVMKNEGGAAQTALLQVLVALRHIARENHLLFGKAVADSAKIEQEDLAGTTEEVLHEDYSLAATSGVGDQAEAETEYGKVEWAEVDCITDDIIALGDNEELPDDQQLHNVANAAKDLFARAFEYGVVKDE